MNNKISKIICVVVILFLSISVNSVSSSNTNLSLNDELDQEQPVFDFPEILGHYEGHCIQPAAQSFTPQKNILTRIFLYADKVGLPNPFTFSIREELDGKDLTSLTYENSHFPTYHNPYWVEFNFNDIPVVYGKTYYMIFSTDCNVNSYSFYEIWMGSNNPYKNGIVYAKIDDSPWEPYENIDFSFKTYGIGNRPDKPIIDGPTNGKAETMYDYNFTATDPDNDDITYYIDWGDNTNTGWLGPYDSGKEITQSHTWSSIGSYMIKVKAKDSYNAESIWGMIEIKIPRSRSLYNFNWMDLLERFPILNRLLNSLDFYLQR